jgi:hypothetical protein
MECRDDDNSNKTFNLYFSLPDGLKVKNSQNMLGISMKTYKNICYSSKLVENSQECTSKNGVIKTECKYLLEGSNLTDTTYLSKCRCSKGFIDRHSCE